MRNQTFPQVGNNSRETLFTPFSFNLPSFGGVPAGFNTRGWGMQPALLSPCPQTGTVQPDTLRERIRSSLLPQRQPAPLSSLRFKSQLFSPLQGLISAPRLVEQQKWRILASLGLLFLSYSAGKQSPAWFSNWIKTNCSAGFDFKHSTFQQCYLT